MAGKQKITQRRHGHSVWHLDLSEPYKTNIYDLDKTSVDQVSRKKLIDEAYLRLSHIYHVNDVLRCMILERAIAMRRSLDAELGWGSFFWIAPQKYRVPSKEGECVARYREWSEENLRK